MVNKINKYVIAGMMSDDKETFMNRLSAILHPAQLQQLVNGIPTDVKITNEEGIINEIKKKIDSSASLETFYGLKLRLHDDGTFSVDARYELSYTKYFVSEQDAKYYEKNGSVYQRDYATSKDDAHPYPGIYHGTSSLIASSEYYEIIYE